MEATAYEQERRRAEALAEIDRAKTAFFSNVSHEFRTPLTLMLGPIEDMLSRPDGAITVERDELNVVHRSGLRLLKLVNTLLDFSRIEAGRSHPSYESVDLAALTADLASIFRSAIEKAGLRLIIDCRPLSKPVYVDRSMWEKIVMNLLSNAFKFTFEGEICVSLTEAGETAELSVSDTGTGIPEQELPHILERFHRIEGSRGRSFEGSGIGLSLVQELVKVHGGHISVESTVGRGSRFIVIVPLGTNHLAVEKHSASKQSSTAIQGEAYVEEALRWLPEASAPEPATDLPAPVESTAERPRILFADDNADLRDYVYRLLEGTYRVELVNDGEAALIAGQHSPPDLLLADLMMPRMDGFELLKSWRDDLRLRSIPVILLSARAGEESRIEGLAAGATDYLVKPFSARELRARISSCLEIACERNAGVAKIQETLSGEVAAKKGAEEVLQASEERWRAAFENSSVGVALCGRKGTFVSANRAFEDIVGYTQEELRDLSWADITYQEDRGTNEALVVKLWQKQLGDFRIEKRYRRKDGQIIWVRTSVSLVPGTHVEPEFTLELVEDITSRKRAEDENQSLRRQLELERDYLRQEVNESQAFGEILGCGDALQRVLRQIELVAPTDTTMLILGESGVGKELVARAVHSHSPRSERALVKVNCGSIPRELFESEFFGHVKGAFTGAVRDRAGRFELADGGTLFLDEVSEIPLELQSKLLRVLQEGEFERVGDEITRRVNVRVIAATNRDLASEVKAGRFRADLFYRIAVFPIEIPPLRDRREDIPILAAHFVDKICSRSNMPKPRLSHHDLLALQRYDWPGNVRELQNVIERGLILARGGPLQIDLPSNELRQAQQAPVPSNQGDDVLTETEWRAQGRENMQKVLSRTGGRIYGPGGAAEILGIHPNTLAYRLKVLGIRSKSGIV